MSESMGCRRVDAKGEVKSSAERATKAKSKLHTSNSGESNESKEQATQEGATKPTSKQLDSAVNQTRKMRD